MLIKVLIGLTIAYQKILKNRHYSFIKVSTVYLVTNQRYDQVIRDYYQYSASLLTLALKKVNIPMLMVLDCNDFEWLKFFIPVKKIVFQIEHTLVKPGARDSDGAVPGMISIANSNSHYLVRLLHFSNLQSADAVIEYSQINQFNIRQIQELALYASKAFCISPALYPLLESSLKLSSDRSLDTITLFGNPDEPRRKAFLRNLNSLGIQSQNINQTFDGVETLYRKTKILINIRQTDHHDTLEELRILPALRCGVIVISESAPLIERTRYSKYVIWGQLDELPDLILDVQKNYAFWHQKIFQDTNFLLRMSRISRRNALNSINLVEYLTVM